MSANGDLARALVAALDDAALDELAQLLAPRLAGRLEVVEPQTPARGWLDAKAAAEYVGLTPNALHKLTAARRIPFEQPAGRGGKCWFRAADLDAWRRGEQP